MYYRRKIILSILENTAKGTLGKINLQKILFLFIQEQEDEVKIYDFVPYQWGAFSFLANKDLSVLSTHYKVIEEDKKKWTLLKNENYFQSIKEKDKKIIKKLFSDFDVENTQSLIQKTYKKYPYSMINTTTKLDTKTRELQELEIKKISNQKNQILFSIGYEGLSIDHYINKLIKNNIKILLDVRKNPISMKYGFSKNQLKNICEKNSIEYQSLPELGIESINRKNLVSFEDYQKLFNLYRKTLEQKESAINKIIMFFEKYQRIAITCFEKDPKCCHRNQISEFIEHKYQYKVSHL